MSLYTDRMNASTSTRTIKMTKPKTTHHKTLSFVRIVEYEIKIDYESFMNGATEYDSEVGFDLSAITREQRQKIWDEMCKESADGEFEEDAGERQPDEDCDWTAEIYEQAVLSAWKKTDDKKEEMNRVIIEAVYHPDRVEKMMEKFGGDYLDEIEGVEY